MTTAQKPGETGHPASSPRRPKAPESRWRTTAPSAKPDLAGMTPGRGGSGTATAQAPPLKILRLLGIGGSSPKPR